MNLERIIGAAALATALFAGKGHAQEAPSAPQEKPAIEEAAQAELPKGLRKVKTIYEIPELEIATHKVAFEDVTERIIWAAGTDDFEALTDILDGIKTHSLGSCNLRFYTFYPKGVNDNLEMEDSEHYRESYTENRQRFKKHLDLLERALGEDHGFAVLHRDEKNKRFLRLNPKHHPQMGILDSHIIKFGIGPDYGVTNERGGKPLINVRAEKHEDGKKTWRQYTSFIDMPNSEFTVIRGTREDRGRWSFSMSKLPGDIYALETRLHEPRGPISCMDTYVFNFRTKKVLAGGRFYVKGWNSDASMIAFQNWGVWKDYNIMNLQTGKIERVCDGHKARYDFEFSPDSNIVVCRKGEFESWGSVPGNYSIEVYNRSNGDYFNIHPKGYGSDYVRSIADDGTLVLKGAAFELRNGEYVCTKTSSGKPLKELNITKRAGK